MTLEEFSKRTIVGLTEEIEIIHGKRREKVRVRIDSGATKSSIDLSLANKLQLGPIVESKIIKSANGARLRPMMEVTINLHGKEITDRFTLADRSHMKYKVLIGQNILKRGFLIDPQQE